MPAGSDDAVQYQQCCNQRQCKAPTVSFSDGREIWLAAAFYARTRLQPECYMCALEFYKRAPKFSIISEKLNMTAYKIYKRIPNFHTRTKIFYKRPPNFYLWEEKSFERQENNYRRGQKVLYIFLFSLYQR